MNTLQNLVGELDGQKVMVIGDLVADVYLEGQISRISREAPVLILEHKEERVVPGGAANAVCNTAALGGDVYAVGFIGEDYAGDELKRALQQLSVHTEGLFASQARPTITKTRIMAGGQATVRQQIVRIDKESHAAIAPAAEAMLLGYIQQHIVDMQAVIISDYGSGTVTPAVRQFVLAYCREHNLPCMVDSRYQIMEYHKVGVVKQNESEAAAALGISSPDEESLIAGGQRMLQELDAKAVLITRGPDGMLLVEETGSIHKIPVTNKSDVYDVTGAGDTVVAAMTLALAAGASYYDAARLANYAAGIVVKKPGTAVTNPQELAQTLADV